MKEYVFHGFCLARERPTTAYTDGCISTQNGVLNRHLAVKSPCGINPSICQPLYDFYVA